MNEPQEGVQTPEARIATKRRALSQAERELGLLEHRIMEAVKRSPYDFRTVASLADQLGVPEDILRAELAEMEAAGSLRRPVVADSKYDDWYRDTRRGLTRQEKWARIRALITFESMRDNY